MICSYMAVFLQGVATCYHWHFFSEWGDVFHSDLSDDIRPIFIFSRWNTSQYWSIPKDTCTLTRLGMFIFFATYLFGAFKFKIFNYFLMGVLLTECSVGIQIGRITQGKRSITWNIMMEILEMFWLLCEVFLEVIRKSFNLEKLPREPSSPCSCAVAELDSSLQ